MAKADTSHHAAARSFNEDEQFEAYKHVLTVMKDKPVTIRTLDAGGDKLINSVDIPSFSEPGFVLLSPSEPSEIGRAHV